jgi:phospholipase/carboxylesterase
MTAPLAANLEGMSKAADNPVTERSLKATINLYYDLIPARHSQAPLLIGLHGYGAHKGQMLREAQQLAPDGFAIASLQGLHQHLREPREQGGPLRFGFGWLTNFRPEESIALHHRALLELIAGLASEGVADAGRVFLLGFSQSCALNYRFAFSHPKSLRGVIGICGGIPGDWESNPNYKQSEASVFHAAGNRDEFYPPERVIDYEMQLAKRSRQVLFKRYDAAHEIVPAMREDVKSWLTRYSQ